MMVSTGKEGRLLLIDRSENPNAFWHFHAWLHLHTRVSRDPRLDRKLKADINDDPYIQCSSTTTTTASSSKRGAEADDGHQEDHQDRPAAVLTVWHKSLLLSCSGFTIFDSDGALAFRVDSYDITRRGLRRRRGGEVVLMDEAGTSLLTVRRRRSRLTSLGMAPDRWLIYDGGSDNTKAKSFLSVRRARLGLPLLDASSSSSNKAPPLAYVTHLLEAGESGVAEASYVVEGSYGARACAVRDTRGDAVVAEVLPKERVGDDVFRLVVGP